MPRIEDPAKQADPVLDAMKSLDAEDQLTVLPALGRVGGPAALQLVQQALASSDSAQHEAGLRALCNWPDASVAPELLKVVQNDKHSGHARMALAA